MGASERTAAKAAPDRARKAGRRCGAREEMRKGISRHQSDCSGIAGDPDGRDWLAVFLSSHFAPAKTPWTLPRRPSGRGALAQPAGPCHPPAASAPSGEEPVSRRGGERGTRDVGRRAQGTSGDRGHGRAVPSLGRAPRRLLAWLLCYLALLQGFSAAAAGAALAARMPRDGVASATAPAGAIICLSHDATGQPPEPHRAAPACCDLCPAAGAPVLPQPHGVLHPLLRRADAPVLVPAGLLPGAGSVCENARSRAPPAA